MNRFVLRQIRSLLAERASVILGNGISGIAVTGVSPPLKPNTDGAVSAKVIQIPVQSCVIILDIGCGIGGSSIWLAKNFGASVIGVDINKERITIAKKLAEENKINDLVSFFAGDFFDSKFFISLSLNKY